MAVNVRPETNSNTETVTKTGSQRAAVAHITDGKTTAPRKSGHKKHASGATRSKPQRRPTVRNVEVERFKTHMSNAKQPRKGTGKHGIRVAESPEHGQLTTRTGQASHNKHVIGSRRKTGGKHPAHNVKTLPASNSLPNQTSHTANSKQELQQETNFRPVTPGKHEMPNKRTAPLVGMRFSNSKSTAGKKTNHKGRGSHVQDHNPFHGKHVPIASSHRETDAPGVSPSIKVTKHKPRRMHRVEKPRSFQQLIGTNRNVLAHGHRDVKHKAPLSTKHKYAPDTTPFKSAGNTHASSNVRTQTNLINKERDRHWSSTSTDIAGSAANTVHPNSQFPKKAALRKGTRKEINNNVSHVSASKRSRKHNEPGAGRSEKSKAHTLVHNDRPEQKRGLAHKKSKPSKQTGMTYIQQKVRKFLTDAQRHGNITANSQDKMAQIYKLMSHLVSVMSNRITQNKPVQKDHSEHKLPHSLSSSNRRRVPRIKADSKSRLGDGTSGSTNMHESNHVNRSNRRRNDRPGKLSSTRPQSTSATEHISDKETERVVAARHIVVGVGQNISLGLPTGGVHSPVLTRPSSNGLKSRTHTSNRNGNGHNGHAVGKKGRNREMKNGGYIYKHKPTSNVNGNGARERPYKHSSDVNGNGVRERPHKPSSNVNGNGVRERPHKPSSNVNGNGARERPHKPSSNVNGNGARERPHKPSSNVNGNGARERPHKPSSNVNGNGARERPHKPSSNVNGNGARERPHKPSSNVNGNGARERPHKPSSNVNGNGVRERPYKPSSNANDNGVRERPHKPSSNVNGNGARERPHKPSSNVNGNGVREQPSTHKAGTDRHSGKVSTSATGGQRGQSRSGGRHKVTGMGSDGGMPHHAKKAPRPCKLAPACGSDMFTYLSECYIPEGLTKLCDGFCPCPAPTVVGPSAVVPSVAVPYVPSPPAIVTRHTPMPQQSPPVRPWQPVREPRPVNVSTTYYSPATDGRDVAHTPHRQTQSQYPRAEPPPREVPCAEHCPTYYQPVCTVYGSTFDNECLQQCSGETLECEGSCPCEPDRSQIRGDYCNCNPREFNPVCTEDGLQLDNECLAVCRGKSVACSSHCPC